MGMSRVSPPPLMLLHGLASTPQEFSVIGQTWRNEGVRLHLPQLTGYSAPNPLRPLPWQRWLDAAVHELRAQDEPVVLGGLCIGAVLALAAALAYPERVAGLVLMSPTLFYDGWGLSRWRWLRHVGYLPGLRTRVQVPEREPYGVKNPQIRKWIARELQQRERSAAGPAALPLWAVHEAERLIRHVRPRLGRITARTLVLHAREDEVASLRSPELLMADLGAQDKQLVVLENSYHMVTLDNDRNTVVRETLDFLGGGRSVAAPARIPASATV